MSKGLTEKRKAALDELSKIEAQVTTIGLQAIHRFVAYGLFAELAAWCQENLTPSTQLNRICDDLWAG
jgi:hypothetical protein